MFLLSIHENKVKHTYSLGLNSFNGLDLGLNIIRGRLERLEGLLNLINDSLVLKNLAVMSKVNGGLLFLEISQDTTSLLVTLAERAQSSNGLGLETKRSGQLGPVNVGSSRLGDRHDEEGGRDGVGEGRGEWMCFPARHCSTCIQNVSRKEPFHHVINTCDKWIIAMEKVWV